jgi:hypothetical protein
MLNELLVLGQVPGTNFQLTFSDYILVLDLVVLFITLERYHHITEKVRYYWLFSHIYFAVHKGFLSVLWQNGLGVKVQLLK